MSMLVEALQPFLFSGLFGVEGPAAMTLDQLLRAGGCYPAFDLATSSWTLEFLDRARVSQMQATECSRMACASLQTFSNVEDDVGDVNRLPWALVCAYYAAYYAANCIGRALGSGCSYLDRDRVTLIGSVLDVYSVPQRPDRGLYIISATPTGSGLSLTKAGPAFGGSHDAFWKVFGARMKAVEDGVMQIGLPAAEAQSVFLQLAAFRSVVARQSRQFNWLSEVRNAIQYRHLFTAWFPSKARSKVRSRMAKIAAAADNDPMDIALDCGEEIYEFLAASSFLVALCRELVKRIADRCASRKSFVEDGPLKYIRQRAG